MHRYKFHVTFVLVALLAVAGLVYSQSTISTNPGTVKATNGTIPTAGAQMTAVGGLVTNTSGLNIQVSQGNPYCKGTIETLALSTFKLLANTTYMVVYNCTTRQSYAKTAVVGPGSPVGQPGVPSTYLAPIPNVESGIASVVCGASTCAGLTDIRIPAQWQLRTQ